MEKLLIEKIFEKTKREPENNEVLEDLFQAIRLYGEEHSEEAKELNFKLRDYCIDKIAKHININGHFEIYRKTLLYAAPDDFDSYLIYMEIDRNPQERFYLPRRRIMKRVADALQRLYDGKIDELFLSEPPRVGKTTMLMFFVTWIIGKEPEKANLYSAYSDTITKAFYNGVLEIINDNHTYKWKDVFPKANIVGTNAAEETLNIDRRKRYPSLTCRSLYGTLNGACDCNGFLICDDLIGGIEEALNRDRMISAWSKVDNNLITRAKENAKILWCGTRWSNLDPAGLRMSLLQEDGRFASRRFEVINLPALNEKEESNFEYDYNLGFSTEYFKMRRASFEKNNDMASWMAQYMGEPIEREGTLFRPEDFRFYNGTLPEEEPDRKFIAVDPAFGGGDFLAAPVCYMYGTDIYIPEVIYSDADKRVTQGLLLSAIEKHGISAIQIEGTKATEGYKVELEQKLKEKGLKINISSKAAGTRVSKEQRIFDKSPDIREMMIFLEESKRDKAYSLFMQNVYSFKVIGKNTHDDAPDSLAMAIDMAVRKPKEIKLIRRAF